MRELAVDVRVKTRFANSAALMAVVSAGIERGALRLPAKIACGRTFQIALLTATGEVAVRGSVESVRHDGDATLVRFLSASDDASNRDAWVDLDDAVVSVPLALAPAPPPSAEASARARAKARERSDWAGAMGTPLPSEVGAHATARVAIPPIPGPRAKAVAPDSTPPVLPDLAETAHGSAPLPTIPAGPSPSGSMPGAPSAPPLTAQTMRPTGTTVPPMPTGTTLPPPLMAVFAGPGGGYYVAPPGMWPADAPPDARMRPTTLPPGWGPEQGRMWIPVMDPAAQPMPNPTPGAAPATGKAARGVLIASVVIATAGAAVAVSAVLWARSVSARQPTPVAPTPAAMPAAIPPAVAPPAAADPNTGEPSPPAAAPGASSIAPPAAAVPPPAAPSPPPAVVAAPAVIATRDCSLMVTTNAERVGIFVDGVRRGDTPARVAVPCGATAVTLRHPRYEDQVRHFEADGDRDELHVIMTRPRAQLRVVTRPSGAVVKIDGRTVGKSPLTTTVDGFERARVTLSAPGMETEERRIYAKSGTTMVNVNLKKK